MMKETQDRNPAQEDLASDTTDTKKKTKGRKNKRGGGIFRRRPLFRAKNNRGESRDPDMTLSQELQAIRCEDFESSSSSVVTSASTATANSTVESELPTKKSSELNKDSQSFHMYLIRYVDRNPGTLPPVEILKKLLDRDYDSSRLKHSTFSGLQSGSDSLPPHLLAAEELLKKYLQFHQHVASRMTPIAGAGPRDYAEIEALSPKMRRQIFQILQDFLRPRILHPDEHHDSQGAKTPSEAAQLLTWMRPVVNRIAEICPELDLSIWRSDMDSLFECYLDAAVRGPCRELLPQKQGGDDDDLRMNAYGHMVTGHPERVVFLLRQQMTVAEAALSPHYAQQVWATCHQELSQGMVADLLMHIGTSWQTISSAHYCAIINDSVRLVDLLEELLEEHPLDEPHRQHADSLLCELTALSMQGVTFLCQSILQDLQQDPSILTSIGTAKWAKNDGVVECTAATLNDYFSDIEGWLADRYWFPKILKTCFDLVHQTYVESFFANTMANGVSDPALVAKALDRDYKAFVHYFKSETFAPYFGRAGFYSEQELDGHLDVVRSLSRVMNPHMEATSILHSVQTVVRAFGPSGAPAVLHLAGMRQHCNGQEDSAEWIQAVARASRKDSFVVEEDSDDEEEPSSSTETSSRGKPIDYRLPDMRNSKYIRNLKALDQNEITRKLSQRSLKAAQATSVLLNAPSPKRPVLSALRRYGYIR